MSLLEDRSHLDVLTKGRTILRGAFWENSIPGGQNENGLLVSQESILPAGGHRKQNEIILTRSEEIESRNLCFPTASITEGESI